MAPFIHSCDAQGEVGEVGEVDLLDPCQVEYLGSLKIVNRSIFREIPGSRAGNSISKNIFAKIALCQDCCTPRHEIRGARSIYMGDLRFLIQIFKSSKIPQILQI